MQYKTYEHLEASVDRMTLVELVDCSDGAIELAFDMGPERNRTYLQMRATDMRRFLKECTP